MPTQAFIPKDLKSPTAQVQEKAAFVPKTSSDEELEAEYREPLVLIRADHHLVVAVLVCSLIIGLILWVYRSRSTDLPLVESEKNSTTAKTMGTHGNSLTGTPQAASKEPQEMVAAATPPKKATGQARQPIWQEEAAQPMVAPPEQTETGLMPTPAEKSDLAREVIFLLESLGQTNTQERKEKILALSQKGEQAIPLLAEALSSPSVHVRLGAVLALGEMGDRAIPSLAQALQTDEPVRSAARELLAGKGKKAVPALLECLHTHREVVCEEAALALARIGQEALPELLQTLQQADFLVCFWVSQTLRLMGQTARPLIEKAMADPDWNVRFWASQAREGKKQ